MYNTNYVVKYRDIEYELISNLHRMELKKQVQAAEVAAAAVAAVLAQTPIKKKGGRKKVLKEEEAVVTKEEAVVTKEEPKKRGRKKAVPVIPVPVPAVTVLTNVVEVVGEIKDEEEDLDIEYTMEDVHLICEKLYRDELLSVFEAESINDPNMDAGIKRVIERMIDSANFKQLLEDIKHEIIDVTKFTGTPTEIQNLERNSEYLIFITLFSQHVFYITHKCICQLFTVNEIDPELIEQLKNKTISLFKK
jgi:hypothetical protein